MLNIFLDFYGLEVYMPYFSLKMKDPSSYCFPKLAGIYNGRWVRCNDFLSYQSLAEHAIACDKIVLYGPNGKIQELQNVFKGCRSPEEMLVKLDLQCV